MIRATSVIARVGFLRSLVRLIFVSRYDKRVAQTLHGLEFRSPIGLAAGFDKEGEIMPAIAALGFGFGEVGSVSADMCEGNPRPWFYRLPKTKSAVINAGLANDGSRVILRRLRNFGPKAFKNFHVILSVAKANSPKVVTETEGIADYITTIKRAKNSKTISAFELNISCPNTYGGEPFTTPTSLGRLLSAVDKVGVKQPIFIKMPLNLSWKQSKGLLEVIVKHNVAGVTMTNLHHDRSKLDLKDKLPDDVTGSFSGKPTWELSNELIRKTYLGYGDRLTIIGVGGVFNAEDAYAKIRLGASAVELITGMLFNGPQLAAEISYDLSGLLRRDGFSHISQAVGVDAKG